MTESTSKSYEGMVRERPEAFDDYSLTPGEPVLGDGYITATMPPHVAERIAAKKAQSAS